MGHCVEVGVLCEYVGTYVVLVEHAEDQRGELAGIALREKLLVDFDETLLGEQPVRAVFQESFVPGVQGNGRKVWQ